MVEGPDARWLGDEFLWLCCALQKKHTVLEDVRSRRSRRHRRNQLTFPSHVQVVFVRSLVQIFAASPTFIVQQVKRVSLKVQVIKVFPPTPFDVSLSDHTQKAGMCCEFFLFFIRWPRKQRCCRALLRAALTGLSYFFPFVPPVFFLPSSVF